MNLEQLISFETAKLAKEKGFNITNRNSYDENTGLMLPLDPYGHCYALEGTCPAPTQSLLQKWLRDREENIIIVIPMRDFHRNYNGWYYEVFTQLTKKDKPVLMISSDENFDTYEEALEKGLQEALKLI